MKSSKYFPAKNEGEMSRKLHGSGNISCKSLTDVGNPNARRLSTAEEDYSLVKVIGQGTFGLSVLYAAEYKATKEIIMLRQIDIDLLTADDLESLKFEMWLSSQLRHPGILLFLSSFVCKSMLLTSYPLFNFGSCYDILQAGFPDGMPELVIAYILHEMLYGLDYLHKMAYIHRAVKASHILVSSDGRVSLSGLRYSKKADFDKKKGLIAHDFPKHTLAVLPWIAPEMLQQNLEGYGARSDMYSIGITALELYTASVPFCGLPPTQILLHKLNGIVLDFHVGDPEGTDCLRAAHVASGFSADSLQMLSPAGRQHHVTLGRKQTTPFRQFVDILLKHHPRDRPDAVTLQSHNFFKQLKKKGKDLSILELLKPLKPITELHPTAGLTSHASALAIAKAAEKLTLDDGWNW